MIKLTKNAAVILVSSFASSFVQAGEFGLFKEDAFENRASITSTTEYNTNPRLIATGEEGVFQQTVTPRYKFSDISENQELFFDFRLVVVRSSKKDIVIDRENPVASLGYIHQYEKGNISASTNYTETSSRNIELTESGVVGADLTSVVRNYNFAWRHDLADRWILNSTAAYNKTDFSGGSSALVSNHNRQLTSALSYQLTETLTPVVQVSYVKQYSGSLDPTSNINYTTGIDWQYSDAWRFGVRYGKNRSFGATSANGWTGSLNASYLVTDYMTLSAELSRQVTPSNLGGLNENERANLNLAYQLSDVSNISFTYNETKNKTVNQTQTTQYSTSYSRNITDRLSLAVNASYRELENPTSNASAKVLGFTLNYDHPAF